MTIRIIIAAIVSLIVLIAGTFFFMQTKDGEVVSVPTNFPIIDTPLASPAPTFVDLLTSTPDLMEQKVLDNIHLDEYYLYPCTVNNSVTDALVLVGEYKQNVTGINSYSGAELAFKSFENQMYTDWGHLIYREAFQPKLEIVSFVTEGVADPDVLADMYRVGTLSDNMTKIYYGWILNYVVVAASQACLLETMKSVYEIH